MTLDDKWTERRKQIAGKLVGGATRKEIAGDLGISLSTVRREIEELVTMTKAGSARKLPLVLQTDFADRLPSSAAFEGKDAPTLNTAIRKSRQNIVFATMIFALVVTGYGMHLLITAQDLWNLQGVNASLIQALHYLTIVGLGVALAVFGGAAERECAVVWIGYFLLDNLILDPFLGGAPHARDEAWATIYVEWFLGNLFFFLGFLTVYKRHQLYYVRLLVGAQIFSIAVHAFQGLLGMLAPFVYAATIVIAYYFLWVILSVGLCIAFNRGEPTSLSRRVTSALLKRIPTSV